MRTLLALAFIALSASCLYAHGIHNCIHDTLNHTYEHHDQMPTYEEPTKRSLADSDWQPMRILVNYDSLTGLTDAQTTFLKTKLMPAVVDFFSKTLAIVRYNSAGTITFRNSKCQDATVPASMINTPINGDFVLFVYATLPSGSALAVGGYCFLGNDNRPIAGITNFNAATVNPDPAQFASQLVVIQHEITHALGFSSGVFKLWKTGPRNTQAINYRGTTGTILNTTRIAETARRHFNCSNITGVEVENQGSGGSLGSHWERRVLGNEAMTASLTLDGRYSAFTLSLLEDSGWYKANYSMAAPLDFGKNKGCSFMFQTCIDPVAKKARFSEYCAPSGNTCVPDGSAKGYCSSTKANSTLYNYFGDNTTTFDIFGDECPTYGSFSNGICSDTTQTPVYFLPEKFGATSKCLTGTLLDARYISDGTVRMACYNTTCSTVDGVKKLTINIGADSYVCPSAGAQITGIKGYSGYLTCPDAALYCAEPSKDIINPNIPL